MDCLTDVGRCRNGLDEPIGHILRVGGREPDAQQGIHRSNLSHEVGEIMITVAIGVHVLTQKCHLPEPASNEIPNLTEDTEQGPAPLSPPGEGNDTEGAELVAAAHDRDPGADSIGAKGNDIVIVFHTREPHGNALFPGECIFDKEREFSVFIGSHDNIDKALFLQEP